MADPKITSVDISRLQECNPNLMEGLKRPQMRETMQGVLKGSDLTVDEKTGEVVASDKVVRFRDVVEQAETVRTFVEAAKGDNTITLEEAKAFVESHEKFRGITPEAFLSEAKTFVEKRWGAICDNLKQYSVEYPLQNFADNLTRYNDGVYKEEFEQGRMSFSPLKSAANLSWFYNFPLFGVLPLEKSPLKHWDYELGREDTIDATHLSGDNMSMEDAFNDHFRRQVAIAALVQVLNKDIDKNRDKGAAWHALGKTQNSETPKTSAENLLKLVEQAGEITFVEEAKRLEGQKKGLRAEDYERQKKIFGETINGAEAAEILRDQLAFEDLFDLVTTTDKKARYDKAISFAQEERCRDMSALGGGKGNHWDWDNAITTEVNNYYFAKTLLETVIREGTPDQQKAARELLYKNIMPISEGPNPNEEGDGSLGQRILWAPFGFVTWGVNTVLRTDYKSPVPYRVMPDEEAMYAPERMIRVGAFFFGAPWVVRGAGATKTWSSLKLDAWRAAEKTNVLQKGVLATVWTADKAWATATIRPIRKPIMNWLTGKTESSTVLSKGKGLMTSPAGRVLAKGATTLAFDEYCSPTSTDRYGPGLNPTAMARIHTLDPLPPEGKE